MNGKPTVEFHTTAKAMKRAFAERARRSGFEAETSGDALRWQMKARRRFSEILGIPLFEKVDPQARRVEVHPSGDVLREEWLVRTERDVVVPVTILVPRGEGPFPVVFALHGHGMAGRLGPSGRHDLAVMKPAFDQYGMDYGLRMAKRGFLAVCPDARGFGQRREGSKQDDVAHPDRFFQGSCAAIQLASVPLGFTLQGMQAWDLMRLLDWIEKDSRAVSGAVGCVGLSGGGMQALNFAALDVRVKAAVVSGYFYGVRQSLQVLHENCMCNMVPRLWEHFDMGDVAAMAAPRSLFIETGDVDHLNGAGGLANVKSQVRIAKGAFRVSGAANRLVHGIFPGPHRFHGEKSLPWLEREIRRATYEGR